MARSPSPVDPKTVIENASLTRLFSPQTQEALARQSRMLVVEPGQLLFSEDEPSTSFYIVCSGRFRIVRYSPDGAEYVLVVVEPGGTIGELSVLDQEPRSASAEAIERSQVLEISSSAIRNAMLAAPETMLAVIAVLATTVRRLTGNTSDLVFLRLDQRIAKFLLQQAEISDTGSAVVHLPMSQSGMAAMLGVARQTYNSALNGLAAQGLIRVDGRTITIPTTWALRDYLDT